MRPPGKPEGPTFPAYDALLLRVRARITSSVWVLRHLSGKARGLRILLYGKDEQRRQTGWIDAQTGEVILARALRNAMPRL